MAEDIKLMEQANAMLTQRLAISKELYDLNNRTASSKNDQYSKERMIAEQKKMAYETTQAQVELMLQTSEQQEVELARLTALGSEKTAQQQQEMDMLAETLRMRQEEPQLLDQTIQKLRAKVAAQKEGAEAAEQERKFVEEEAAAWGKNLANAMGFRKEQDSMLKKFMQSKNKIKAMTSAMKAFVSQISLAQIGTKIMQSSMQVLTGVMTKLFGKKGGGGGNNIHQFVKMTGQANNGLAKMAKSAGRLGKKLKVGFDEGAKSVGHLMDGVTGFMNMSKKSQKELVGITVRMQAFNVEAELSAKVIDQMMNRWGKSAKAAKKSMVTMFNSAKKLGIPISKYVEDFSEFASAVPSDGRNIEKRFRDMAAAAKAVNVQVKTMLDLAKGFETFENATKGAAQMNQILGKAVFNNIELMKAANESPEKFADKMQQGLKRAGKSWSDLTIYQKKAMAKSANMDIGDMEKLMGGAKGKALSRVQKARKSVQNITGAVKAFNQALKKTKPPGGGGGKDFWSTVLKEYNEITGGKFFRKLKIARGNLKDVIKAVARFIACWIRKIEKWFINAATGFIDAFSGAINWVGSLFGNDDLASDMRKWVKEIDGWGPVLIPILGIVAGGLVKISGVALTLVSTFAQLTWAMGKGLLKGIGGVPSVLGGIRDRFAGIRDAIMDPNGGTFISRASRAWGALMGHTGDTNAAALARKAQPVMVVNSRMNAVPTTADSTVTATDVASAASSFVGRRNNAAIKGGRLGKVGFLQRLYGGAKGALQGAWAGRKYTDTNIGGFRGMARGFKTGRTGAINQMNRVHQFKQLSDLRAAGQMGPELTNQVLKNNAAGKNLSQLRAGARADLFAQGGKGSLIKQYKLLNPGAGSKDALAAIRGGWTPNAGALQQATRVSSVNATLGRGGKLGGAGGNRALAGTRSYARMNPNAMMAQGKGSFGVMDKTAQGLSKNRYGSAGMGVLGKSLSVAGAAYGGYEMFQGIKKGDWSELGSGIYNTTAALSAFIPVVGPFISGIMFAGKAIYDWGKYTKTAIVTNEDIMKNMSIAGQRYLEAEKKRAAKMAQLPDVIMRLLRKATGNSAGVINSLREREQIDKDYGVTEISNMSTNATREQEWRSKRALAGNLSGLQGDFSAINRKRRGTGGRQGYVAPVLTKEKADAMKQEKLDKKFMTWEIGRKKKHKAEMDAIAKRRLNIVKRYNLQEINLTKDESALIEARKVAALDQARREHTAALMALRDTDAYKDTRGSEADAEFQRQAMERGLARKDLFNREQRAAHAENLAFLEIQSQRAAAGVTTLFDGGDWELGYREALKKGQAAVTKYLQDGWNYKSGLLLTHLERKLRGGAGTASDRSQIKVLKGQQRLGQAEDAFNRYLVQKQVAAGGFGVGTNNASRYVASGQTDSSYGDALLKGQMGTGDRGTERRDVDMDKDFAKIAGLVRNSKISYTKGVVKAAMNSDELGGIKDIIQDGILGGRSFSVKGETLNANMIAERLLGRISKDIVADPSKFKVEVDKVLKDMGVDLSKGFDVAKLKTLEEQTEDFKQKGFKVSKQDIENFASYEKALKTFTQFATSGDIEAKLDPVIRTVDKLRLAGGDPTAGQFYYGLGTFFYHARYLKKSHGAAIEQIGESIKKMKANVTPAEMEQMAGAVQKLTTSATGEGGKTAIADALATLEAWEKVKTHVNKFAKETAEGKLFFQGGSIDQTVKADMTVKLVVGGKEFGKATLEGLKQAGAITNVSAKPQLARAKG